MNPLKLKESLGPGQAYSQLPSLVQAAVFQKMIVLFLIKKAPGKNRVSCNFACFPLVWLDCLENLHHLLGRFRLADIRICVECQGLLDVLRLGTDDDHFDGRINLVK